MFENEKNKLNIKADLLKFSPEITVVSLNAIGLFNEVLKDNPHIYARIKEWKYYKGLISTKFEISYSDVTTPLIEPSFAKTKEELEEIVHSSVQKFDRIKGVIVGNGVDPLEVYNEFYRDYGAFYSNLKMIQCQTYDYGKPKHIYCEFSFEYRVGKVKLVFMEKDVEKKIEEIGRQLFLPDMPHEAIAYIAHNYLAKTVTYYNKDEPNPLEESYIQSAYGALITRKCVCQGYAEAYKRILNSQGVFCEVITGKIKNSFEYHAWNVVSLNGRDFYHVDVTWDSLGSGEKQNKYFGLDDKSLEEERSWTARDGIQCNSGKSLLFAAKARIKQKESLYLAKGIPQEYLI